jgi:hypothetical protein
MPSKNTKTIALDEEIVDRFILVCKKSDIKIIRAASDVFQEFLKSIDDDPLKLHDWWHKINTQKMLDGKKE